MCRCAHVCKIIYTSEPEQQTEEVCFYLQPSKQMLLSDTELGLHSSTDVSSFSCFYSSTLFNCNTQVASYFI